jgi:hypothetical protein
MQWRSQPCLQQPLAQLVHVDHAGFPSFAAASYVVPNSQELNTPGESTHGNLNKQGNTATADLCQQRV